MRSVWTTIVLLAGLRAFAADPAAIADAHWQAHGAELLTEWAQVLAIPNHAQDGTNIQRNAEWLKQAFERRGFAMKLWRQGDAPPAVYGRLELPGATRTLGIYLHYDGQPVDRAQWQSDPFHPTLRDAAGADLPWPRAGTALQDDWRVYGRSTSDDKAPVAALLGALDALRAADLPVRSNLILFFEGEEEAGSTHLADYFRVLRQQLQADLWIILDGPVHQSGVPQLLFGVRGITGLEITVYGATRTLHSGHYGNWSPNPALMLAQLLASMKDEDGHVLVEGYYDSVDPLDELTQAAIAALPEIDGDLRAELGLAASEDDNAPYMQRILLPSLNIRGFVSATVGETARNIVPQEATASLDLRLVKGNDPEQMKDLVEAHIRSRGYHIVRKEPTSEERRSHPRIARVVRQEGYRAVRSPMDTPMALWLQERVRAATDDELAMLPSLGGSLPLYVFEDELGAMTIGMPLANHDNNQHAPNENLRLGNLRYGIKAIASVLAGQNP